ncbi:hypothetical protein QVD17_02144 [Tagetes erecta]|uniref:J domain-containing protein n=1 Tax=Tagetes erecta TaxID=13708 RepID=A0AAD8P246_TARER|nr:hypothetical protein QVD17_02144 [Tagetes erecta]
MQPTSQAGAEADRLLAIAENLLEQKDLNAARDFALLAQETEPLLDGSDQIMAITDVLIASNQRINDANHHYYAILQVDINRIHDSDFVKQQYRRLALLLHPDKNKYSFSDSAFKLVAEAWSVLSDTSKKTVYDKQLLEFLKVNEGSSCENLSLWTLCPYCYYLYEYPSIYEGCCLRCQKCDRAFQVVEIPTQAMPPIVPGKEAYCCLWPYFPTGFTISDSEKMPPLPAQTTGKRGWPVNNQVS